MLEIGCGVGWLAYDLAGELDRAGSYTGFDVSPAAIGWLNENLAPRLPNFRFDLVDARNPRYRPDDGAAAAERSPFPYADREFDLVCAFGVFMHVDRDGIERYLAEIARVLEAGRPALLSFMAVTPLDEAPRNGPRAYVEVEPGVYTSRPDREGWSLAFDDALIRDMIERAGLDARRRVKRVRGTDAARSGGEAVPGADLYVVSPGGRDELGLRRRLRCASPACTAAARRSSRARCASSASRSATPSGMLRPGPDNPKGYFEVQAIVQLDDELLAHLGGAWDQPPVLDPGWEHDAGPRAVPGAGRGDPRRDVRAAPGSGRR